MTAFELWYTVNPFTDTSRLEAAIRNLLLDPKKVATKKFIFKFARVERLEDELYQSMLTSFV